MTIRRSRAALLFLVLPLFAVKIFAAITQEVSAVTARQPVKEIQLEGKVVCLAEELHDRFGAQLPADHPHIYGFRTADGTLYTLLRTKLSEGLFTDERLRQKTLNLKGRLFPQSHVFETFAIRSLRSGILQEVYYYCAICEIQMVAPGKCECCQGPVELIEKPMKDHNR